LAIYTTRSTSPVIAKLRWAILAVTLILLVGFVVVLAWVIGAGKR
jgi:flagellar biogenesis protein FliO